MGAAELVELEEVVGAGDWLVALLLLPHPASPRAAVRAPAPSTARHIVLLVVRFTVVFYLSSGSLATGG